MQIETDVSEYVIENILSKLTFNYLIFKLDFPKSDFSQQHLIANFFKKMILINTKYKTHNTELLVIIKVFKTWHYYLKGYKQEVFVFINYNNLYCFIDIKNLSFCQVFWAQKFFCNYFQINYYQRKVNRAINVFFVIFKGARAKKTII